MRQTALVRVEIQAMHATRVRRKKTEGHKGTLVLAQTNGCGTTWHWRGATARLLK